MAAMLMAVNTHPSVGARVGRVKATRVWTMSTVSTVSAVDWRHRATLVMPVLVALALLILMLIGRLRVVGPLAAFITAIVGVGACVPEWRRKRQPPIAASA